MRILFQVNYDLITYIEWLIEVIEILIKYKNGYSYVSVGVSEYLSHFYSIHLKNWGYIQGIFNEDLRHSLQSHTNPYNYFA